MRHLFRARPFNALALLVPLGLLACGHPSGTPTDLGFPDIPPACLAGCPGGTCQSGRCTYVVALCEASPSSIAVDVNWIYWTDYEDASGGGAVRRAPIGGGMPSTLAPNQDSPLSVAVDGSNVYWTNFGRGSDGAVLSMPIAGGSPRTLASAQCEPDGVQAIPGWVFWVACNQLFSLPNGGGTPYVFGVASGVIPGFALDPNGPAYWTDWEGGTIYAGHLLGSPVSQKVFQSGIDHPWAVALGDRANIFWTTLPISPDGGTGGGTVMQAPIAGGTPIVLATGQAWPSSIVTDAPFGGSSVYWADANGGAIYSTPIGGGTVKLFESGLYETQALAVDSHSVYWVESYGIPGPPGPSGAVMRADR